MLPRPMLEQLQEQTRGPRHAKPKRRRRYRWLVVLLVLALLAGGGVYAATTYYRWCQGASGPQQPVTLTIPEGTSGSSIVSMLHDKGVIRCNLVDRFVLRREGIGNDIRAGTYHLTTNMTLDDAIKVLSTPPHKAVTVRMTIPEGFRLTEIAARVHDLFGIPTKEFLREATSGSYSLPPYLPDGKRTVEGFLFPETYQVVKKTATASSVIRLLLSQFQKEVQDLPWDNAKKLGVTPYQVVTIASMIEREAKLDKERPLIAAVIYNRLKINMPLAIDATIQYIDPDPSNGITESDLQIQSPFNTRLHPGLPPTPIASPRLSSIDAALNPAHVSYLYYVLCPKDGPGKHRFSTSYADFIKNKNECLG
jgi:UPF0755 protein